MYFASFVAAVAAMYSASHDDWAITDCVRAPAIINAPSGIITHEETDLRVGQSDAQTLSVYTVWVVHALLCMCSVKQKSSVPQR